MEIINYAIHNHWPGLAVQGLPETVSQDLFWTAPGTFWMQVGGKFCMPVDNQNTGLVLCHLFLLFDVLSSIFYQVVSNGASLWLKILNSRYSYAPTRAFCNSDISKFDLKLKGCLNYLYFVWVTRFQ
jgi:hypothetical protein